MSQGPFLLSFGTIERNRTAAAVTDHARFTQAFLIATILPARQRCVRMYVQWAQWHISAPYGNTICAKLILSSFCLPTGLISRWYSQMALLTHRYGQLLSLILLSAFVISSRIPNFKSLSDRQQRTILDTIERCSILNRIFRMRILNLEIQKQDLNSMKIRNCDPRISVATGAWLWP